MHPCVHIQDTETALMPINRGMGKGGAVPAYNGTLLSHRKERNNATCSITAGPRSDHTQ